MTWRPIFTDRCVTTLIGKATSANIPDVQRKQRETLMRSFVKHELWIRFTALLS